MASVFSIYLRLICIKIYHIRCQMGKYFELFFLGGGDARVEEEESCSINWRFDGFTACARFFFSHCWCCSLSSFSRTKCHEKGITSAPCCLCAVLVPARNIDQEQIVSCPVAITSLWKLYQMEFLERLLQCGNQLFHMITVNNFLKGKRVQKLK